MLGTLRLSTNQRCRHFNHSHKQQAALESEIVKWLIGD